MTKTAARLDKEIAMVIAGDAELEGKLDEAKAIRKQGKAPRTGVRGGPLLGYTQSGKPVHEPARNSPDTNNVDTFIKTKAKFPGWTKADHMDAERILTEKANVAYYQGSNDALARKYRGWAAVHWDIGGRWTGPEAEIRAERIREGQ